jgi:hypothetical protein
MINQLAFPGLGTIMAGQRSGYFQAAIMLAGFFLTMGFFCWYFILLARYITSPGWTQDYFRAQYRAYIWTVLTGLGLCLVAWCWALFSSITLVRKVSRGAQPK